MKAQVYETVNFPSYAIGSFDYGLALDNESDNIRMINWEIAIKLDIAQNGYRFVSIEFGESEYFCTMPCFGLPCTCVEATIYVEKL